MVMGSVTVTTQCIPITETVFGQVNGGEAKEGGGVRGVGGEGVGVRAGTRLGT